MKMGNSPDLSHSQAQSDGAGCNNSPQETITKEGHTFTSDATICAPPHHHITYRSDIDGLRALAIIPVVLFHLFEDRFFPGGKATTDIPW